MSESQKLQALSIKFKIRLHPLPVYEFVLSRKKQSTQSKRKYLLLQKVASNAQETHFFELHGELSWPKYKSLLQIVSCLETLFTHLLQQILITTLIVEIPGKKLFQCSYRVIKKPQPFATFGGLSQQSFMQRKICLFSC